MQESSGVFREPLKEPSMPLYKFVGSLLILFGVSMLWFSWQYQNWIGGVLGLAFFAGGIALVFAAEGIEIRCSEKKFRNYSSIFGVVWGEWKALPKLDYITIYHEKLGMNSHVASLHYTLHDQKLKIALVYGNHQQIAVGRFNSNEKALEAGKYLAIQLETKLLDYTQKEPVWLIE